MANNHAYQGKYDLAFEEANKAISLNPMSYGKGRIYHLKGDFIEAEEDYKSWLETDRAVLQLRGRRWLEVLYRTQGRYEKAKEQAQQGFDLSEKLGEMVWKSRFHFQLANIYRISGNPEMAVEEYDKAWRNAVENKLWEAQVGAINMRGHTYLEMKSIEKAQAEAEKLREMIQKSLFKKRIRFYHRLMGKTELERGNFSKAIDYFKQANSLLPAQSSWVDNHAWFIYPLGLAYFKSGDLDGALGEFGKIVALTTGRIWYGDFYAKSFHMAGKACEELGNKAKAIENYEKFLELWGDADPEFTEVPDARKKLAALKGQ